MTDEARRESLEIFPELEDKEQVEDLARPTVRRQALVAKLLARHQKNGKELVLVEP